MPTLVRRLDTADALESAARMIDSCGLARGRFTDSAGRLSIEGALQQALQLQGGSVRDTPRSYRLALDAVEQAIGDAALARRRAPGRQALSSWNDHEDTTTDEAVRVLLAAASFVRSIEWS